MTTTSFHAIDPRTGAPLDLRFTEASADDAHRAVAAAAAAFDEHDDRRASLAAPRSAA